MDTMDNVVDGFQVCQYNIELDLSTSRYLFELNLELRKVRAQLLACVFIRAHRASGHVALNLLEQARRRRVVNLFECVAMITINIRPFLVQIFVFAMPFRRPLKAPCKLSRIYPG